MKIKLKFNELVESLDFKDIREELPELFQVCLLVLTDNMLSAGCYSQIDDSPGEFHQARGGIIDIEYVKYWIGIEHITIEERENETSN